MADPVLSWITIIGGAVSAIGAIQQGNAASNTAKSQAQAADYNAKLAEGQAETARQISTQEQLAHRRSVQQFQGRQRAAIAQSGTGFEGSNADILEQSATLAELDALNIAYAGERRAAGFASQSALDTYQAGAYRSNASAARTGGYLGAVGAAANAGSRLYQPKSIIGQEYGTMYGLRGRSGIGLRLG